MQCHARLIVECFMLSFPYTANTPAVFFFCLKAAANVKERYQQYLLKPVLLGIGRC